MNAAGPFDATAPRRGVDLPCGARIEVVAGTDRDHAVVARQLGMDLATSATGGADLTVRFVPQLPLERGALTVGRDTAVSDDRLVLLRGKRKEHVRVALPFGRLHEPCEILCQSGLEAVPHLLDVLNVRLISRGVLPLHASAFTFDGTGVVVTGWAKGGKTETLLAFAAHGARFVADEWVHLGASDRMSGVPEAIRLWAWQLEAMPELAARVDRWSRRKVSALATAAAVGGGVADRGLRRRIAHLLGDQASVQVPPTALFGDEGCARVGRADVVVLAASHRSPDVTVTRADGGVVAEAMRASLASERHGLMELYRAFRFAFPGRADPALETLEDRERALLHLRLDDRPTYVLRHPAPLDIRRLYEVLAPTIRHAGPARSAPSRPAGRGHSPATDTSRSDTPAGVP